MAERVSTADDGGEVDELPILTGYMIKRGRLFPTWHRRYFELFPSRLVYYTDANKVSQKGSFKLHADMMCSDSSTRHFCFCLFQPGNDNRYEIMYLATFTMEEKENWMGTNREKTFSWILKYLITFLFL